ncbi:probable E3 ubiquitin-protein ligase ZFP1 [Solanum stenotomum]|uniref:probable E3 ubiquitin-protein ligase ZFP1 n=1 Tax=Solanum stenotomum TaxID=172797 RepID=UPI0020D1BDF6|nr:probable E3 ubiquitin-protein ligase ZFP1 [Solanum stenotomum]
MESNNSHVDNSTVNGNSTPANVPRDVGTTESIVGNVLPQIEEQRAAYQEFYHRYLALFPTLNVIPERDGDDGQEILELHTRITAGLRLMAFHLSTKIHTYQLPKSTCLDGKERCSICLDDYYDKEKLTEINCGHLYHFGCIREWIKLKNSCPICKRDAGARIN